MLEKIIRQIENELQSNGYRQNDIIDKTTKADIVDRSALKKALDYRFANRSEVSIEEIHKLSRYSEIRDIIEKHLEKNNIILATSDLQEGQNEQEKLEEDEKDINLNDKYSGSLDSRTQYYHEIKKIPLLTHEEEVELFMRKRKLEDDMNTIAKKVWVNIIKEVKNDINSIPKSCLKDIKEFYKEQVELLNNIKEIDNKLKAIENSNNINKNTSSSVHYKNIKEEKNMWCSQYKSYELEAANKVCRKLIEEKNNGSVNIPNSCINLIKEYEPLNEENQKIKDKIVKSNLRLVASIASAYASAEEKPFAFLDLVQEGNFGLMKAVERFDVTKGFKFSTYATWWIRQSVGRSKADSDRTIRVPVHMVESIRKLYRMQFLLTQELNREPSNQELADALNVSIEKVEDILQFGQDVVSLYATIGEDDESYLIDFIPDEGITTEQTADQQELHKAVMDVLDTLSDREKRVLILRFGLDGKDPRTLQEVGKEFNVTRERIRQIEAKALRKMRHPSRSRKIKDFKK